MVIKLTLTSTEQRLLEKKKGKLKEKIKAVCEFLYGLGAKKVYVFGSWAKGRYGLHSDVDFAVAGLPEEYIYAVEGKIEDIMGDIKFDLVYFETAPLWLQEKIMKEGILWKA